MKKIKWVRGKDIFRDVSYSIYLPKNDYRVALIKKRKDGLYWLKVPYIEVECKNLFTDLNDAKSEAIKRLKDISEDLQNLLK